MNVKELIERIKKLDEPYLKAEFVLNGVKATNKEKLKVWLNVKKSKFRSVWQIGLRNVKRLNILL